MNKPKLSIIIPAYNTDKYVSECLDSIISQNATNYEIIIIDDGSTDKTPEICDKYAKNYNYVKVFHLQNTGVSNARNLGIKKAAGELIWFVDSDDTVKPNSINVIVDKSRNSDLLIFGINEFGKKNNRDRKFKNKCIDKHETIHRMLEDDDIRGYLFSKVFRASIIKKYQILFDNNIKTCEDLLFCIEYTNHIEKADIISDVLYSYRQRRNGAIHSKLNKKQATALEAFSKIEEICSEKNSIIKAKALFVKAYYKYKPVLSKHQKTIYDKQRKKYEKSYNFFSKKDRLLITGYRFFHPMMLMLHRNQFKGKGLYD